MSFLYENLGWVLYAIVCFFVALAVYRDYRGKVITIGDIPKSIIIVAAAPFLAVGVAVVWLITIIASLDFWETPIYDPYKMVK